MFSDKSHSFFKKLKFWNFFEILLILLHSTEGFQLLVKLQKFLISPGKSIEFFLKKPKFWTFWENSVIQSEIKANLLPLRILRKPRLSSKILSFLRKNAKFWKFWEFSLFQSHSTANLILLENLKTLKTVFRKIRFFFRKTPISECFEKSYYFNCILQKNS